MQSNCVVFFVCLLVLGDIFLVSLSAENIQDQCNDHCFSIISPILEATDELKNKVISLENAVREVRSQLKNSNAARGTEDTQIGEKEAEIKIGTSSTPDFCPIGSQAETFSLKLQGIEPFGATQCSPTAYGWIVIQRRLDGSVNFNRTWLDYKAGFGNINGEFFIGLERLHLMTQEQPHELLIQLRNVNGDTVYAKFDDFQVGSETDNYKLELLGKFSGTAEYAHKTQQGKMFSTFDHDNDESGMNCAAVRGGGWWWYDRCSTSFLNGVYFRDGERYGIRWQYRSFIFVQMMIRRKLF